MTLQKYIESLPENGQVILAIKLIKLALPLWDTYSCKNDLSYRDKVVGLKYSVEKQLLQNTVTTIEKYLNSNKLKKIISKGKLQRLRGMFDDPIVALQDNDWSLPYEIQNIFYSVYNLIDTFLGNDQSSMYISINQSADALEMSKVLTYDEIRIILMELV